MTAEDIKQEIALNNKIRANFEKIMAIPSTSSYWKRLLCSTVLHITEQDDYYIQYRLRIQYGMDVSDWETDHTIYTHDLMRHYLATLPMDEPKVYSEAERLAYVRMVDVSLLEEYPELSYEEYLSCVRSRIRSILYNEFLFCSCDMKDVFEYIDSMGLPGFIDWLEHYGDLLEHDSPAVRRRYYRKQYFYSCLPHMKEREA